MKIIIAGAHGSVGQRLVLLALKSPEHHTVLGLDFSPHPAPSPYLGQPPINYDVEEARKEGRYTFMQIDLREYERVVRVMETWIENTVGQGADNGVGLANLAGIRNPSDGIVKTHNTNVVISWNLLRACAELGINRIAQASSVNVLRGVFSETPEFHYFPIDEEHPCEPDEPYGLSKIIMETQASTLTRRYPHIRIASLRLHWSVPTRSDSKRTNESKAAADLWGWVQEDEGVRAFLLALTLPLAVDEFPPSNLDKKRNESGDENADRKATATGWKGHETFYIVAPDLQMLGSAEGDVDGTKLKEEWWPAAKVREGWWGPELDTPNRSGHHGEREWVGDAAGRVEPRRRGFYDCKKAERMLGWVHAAN